MKLFFREQKEKKGSPKRLVLVLGTLLFGTVFVTSGFLASEFPWKGNPLDWLKARESYDQAEGFRRSFILSEAVRRYKAAIEIYPDDWKFHKGLGSVYMQMKKYPEAEKELNEVIKLHPKDFESWLQLADNRLSQRGTSLDGAEKAVRKAMEIEPNNAEAIALLSLIQFINGKKEEAEKTYNTCLLLDKESPRFWFYSAQYHFCMKDLQRTEAELKQAAELARSNPEYWAGLGVFMQDMGNMETADIALKNATSLNKFEPRYWSAYGKIKMQMNEPDKAIECYKRAAELDTNNKETLVALCKAFIANGRFAQAEEPLHHLLELDPENLDVWSSYMKVLEKQNKYAEAEKEMIKTINKESRKDEASAWIYLASIQMKAEAFDRAEESLKTASTLCKNQDEMNHVAEVFQELNAQKSSFESKTKTNTSLKPDESNVHRKEQDTAKTPTPN